MVGGLGHAHQGPQLKAVLARPDPPVLDSQVVDVDQGLGAHRFQAHQVDQGGAPGQEGGGRRRAPSPRPTDGLIDGVGALVGERAHVRPSSCRPPA